MTKQKLALLTALILVFLATAHTQPTVKITPQTAADSVELAEKWFKKGEIKYKLRNYAESIADFDQAILLNPHYVFFNYRGNAQYNLGRYPEAIANYDLVIRLKPDYVQAYNSRGVAKRNLGQFKESIVDYDQAIKLKPDYVIAYSSRGVAKVALKQYDSALLDYEKAIKIDSTYAKAYANKGCCLVKIGDKKRLQEAIISLDKGLTLDGTLNYARDCKNEAENKLKQ